MVIKTEQEIRVNYEGSMSSGLVLLIICITFKIRSYIALALCVLFLITYLTKTILFYLTQNNNIENLVLSIDYTITLIGILTISSYTSFMLEKSNRNNFISKNQLQFSLQKAQTILGYLLPDFVKQRVKEGVTYIEEKDSVTILFCEIQNFYNIFTTHESNELLEILNKFFAVLDQICEKNGVTKIESVNNTYMICAGLSETNENHLPFEVVNRNHAERCIETALEILKKIEPVYLKTGLKLQVKIGIHSGKVIAGVVGEHKPQFSVFGDSVNASVRMCKYLKSPDKIIISNTTNSLIKGQKYSFVKNFLSIKGQHDEELYFFDLFL